MLSFAGIHCLPSDIPFVSRPPQLCLHRRKLIFCLANQPLLGQSSFPNSTLDGSSHEDRGGTPLNGIGNFPHPPDTGKPVPSTPKHGRSDSKSLRAVLQVSVPGPSGTLPPHVLYLLELGFDLEQIKLIAKIYPGFAKYSLEGKVRPVIEFLLDLGVSKSDLPNILIKYPQLCGMALPKENLVPPLAILESLGVDKSKWPKLISVFPLFLTYSRKKVHETVEFLYELGLSEEDMGKILTLCPQIVCCSVKEKLRPSVEYFRSLGVDAARLLRHCPQIMNLSLETKLKPSTEFFLENGFTIEEVGSMISRFGSLYKYSLKGNMVPKWEFFLTTEYSRQDLIKFPQYFGYSLKERIQPRYKLVKESGLKLPLNVLLVEDHYRFELLLRKKIEKLQSLCN